MDQPAHSGAEEGEDAQGGRVFDSALYLAENLEKAPAFVIACVDEDLGEKWTITRSVS